MMLNSASLLESFFQRLSVYVVINLGGIPLLQ